MSKIPKNSLERSSVVSVTPLVSIEVPSLLLRKLAAVKSGWPPGPINPNAPGISFLAFSMLSSVGCAFFSVLNVALDSAIYSDCAFSLAGTYAFTFTSTPGGCVTSLRSRCRINAVWSSFGSPDCDNSRSNSPGFCLICSNLMRLASVTGSPKAPSSFCSGPNLLFS